MSNIHIRLNDAQQANRFVEALETAGIKRTLEEFGGGSISYLRSIGVPRKSVLRNVARQAEQTPATADMPTPELIDALTRLRTMDVSAVQTGGGFEVSIELTPICFRVGGLRIPLLVKLVNRELRRILPELNWLCSQAAKDRETYEQTASQSEPPKP